MRGVCGILGVHFYPRPPRGGRRLSDGIQTRYAVFLSTPSARRATVDFFGRLCRVGISIHALREEGDPLLSKETADSWYFYPRPPRGGRPEPLVPDLDISSISIHALREEGDGFALRGRTNGGHISIHALREEGDSYDCSNVLDTIRFLSTPSARRATSA